MKRKILVKGLIFILVLVVLFIYCYPLLYLFSTSLKDKSEFLMNPVGIVKDIRLANYVDAWKEAK